MISRKILIRVRTRIRITVSIRIRRRVGRTIRISMMIRI